MILHLPLHELPFRRWVILPILVVTCIRKVILHLLWYVMVLERLQSTESIYAWWFRLLWRWTKLVSHVG